MVAGQTSLKSVHLTDHQGYSALKGEEELALKMLVESSVFIPANFKNAGPYDLSLSVNDGRLLMAMKDTNDNPLPSLILSIKPYSRLVRDYFMMIESYETMRRNGTAEQLEAVDMGRRGLHDEGARLLMDRLSGKVTLDHETARRMFTLICVLHGQHMPLF